MHNYVISIKQLMITCRDYTTCAQIPACKHAQVNQQNIMLNATAPKPQYIALKT